MDEEQAYRLWNMGNGMLLVTSAEEKEKIFEICEQNKYEVRVCGAVREEAGIELHTKGFQPKRIVY